MVGEDGVRVRVLVAGATGVIGRRLVPLLVGAGHAVVGLTRSAERGRALRLLGAASLVCDVFDEAAVEAAVVGARPEVVIHQLTDLPDDRRLVAHRAESNARMRREGTRNLLRAARAAGVTRLLAQSVAWKLQGDSGRAVRDLEQSVLAYPGVVLRYGQFYGSGTYWPHQLPPAPRVQIDSAARATVAALLLDSQILRIVDPEDQ